jgi:poly(beta-D-mannuronate) lyase
LRYFRDISATALASVLACSAIALSACSAGNVSEGETSQTSEDSAFRVETAEALEDAIAKAQPGDVIALADGIYRDLEILFEAEGTAEAPITLRAESLGGVVLSGQSNLRLSGEYLIVEGLVFKDGYTPTSAVIEFRKDSDTLANNSIVRNTVIDGYSNPERYETDAWVMIYGKNNRFERNHLSGKGNQGVTLAVRMNTEASRENDHVIANNYFGPRAILGSNGGETLRIGTSHYSRSDSRTVVENNVFDRTNGELEVISVKSGANILRGNSFLGARGTLTMRHGNNNIIENNVFLGGAGDGENEHTGGIRVINAGQQVRNNYMEALTGTRFGGAFVVMNGVPNGPINRYDPVIGARIENNSIIGTNPIQLGAGSDSERSAVPEDSTFANNLVSPSGDEAFKLYDDMSGIDFSDNIMVGAAVPEFTGGFARQDLSLSRAANGLLYPPAGTDVGAPRDLKVTQLEDVGVSWYPKTPARVEFGSGEVISVPAEPGAFFAATQKANPGDVLNLAAGTHAVRKTLALRVPVTIRAGGDANLTFQRSALFQIENGGALRLEGLTISGKEAPDMVGNALIRTSPYAMTQNYRLEIIDTVVEDLDINRFFDVVRGSKGTMADHIRIEGSTFRNISGSVFKLDAERDDFGRYNAEYVTISDSMFEAVQGPLAALYRGGRDESTFGPHFEMVDSKLSDVGNGGRNALGASLWLHGVQDTDITNNTFDGLPAFKIDHTVGEPQTDINTNRFMGTPAPKVIEITSGLPPQARIENNDGL